MKKYSIFNKIINFFLNSWYGCWNKDYDSDKSLVEMAEYARKVGYSQGVIRMQYQLGDLSENKYAEYSSAYTKHHEKNL